MVSTVLQRPLTDLKGVGDKLAEKLSAAGLNCIQDLLFHLPYRYQDRTRTALIGSLSNGMAVVVDAKVAGSQVVFGRQGRRSLLVRVSDNTGLLTLRFFHFSAAQKNQLSTGQRLICYGEIRLGATGLEMVHPEYKLADKADVYSPENALTPFYSTTESIQQNRIRNLVQQSLEWLSQLPELLPRDVLSQLNFPDIQTALATIHHPPTTAPTEDFLNGSHVCQQRLALEELLAHHLQLRLKKQQQMSEVAPQFKPTNDIALSVESKLGFSLTSAQQRVLGEIRQDLAKPYPMARLVQGDVGAGKTLVALLAGLQAVESGYQFAMMAPTEILAEQHYQSISRWLEPHGIVTTLLTGKLPKAVRKLALEKIVSGEAGVVIGTHALFQDSVQFNNLGFIVIDEQHRFGVAQRLAFRNKSLHNQWVPHQLAMTATPIPRTLAQSMYADLDYSQIDELPPGRQQIVTRVLSQQKREEIIARVANACQERKQIYWVCTLIEESEELQCQAAENTAELLRLALPSARVGLVHGKLKSSEKQQVMERFKQHHIDLLVATTVIEVGVDVPNATVMIIENPERLGLSQLHQLRGRIGRGDQQSFCLLVYGDALSQVSRQRLEVMRRSQDGFEIAEMDLKLRGPGEILGVRQTGLQQFRVADLQRDIHLLPEVQRLSENIVRHHPDIVDSLLKRWLDLDQKYAKV